LKINKSLITVLVVFGLLFSACGGSGDTVTENIETQSISPETIVINGAVNDVPIPFARVSLVEYPSGKKLTESIIADVNGKWSFSLDKNLLSPNAFVMIKAVNRKNNASIRSAIDTDKIIAALGNYEADETTVSHYTEAAIVLSEIEGGLDQEKHDRLLGHIKLNNGNPVDTGSDEIDKLAKTIQKSFDNNTSSNDELILHTYEHLVGQIAEVAIPDEHGKVELGLPTLYNNDIEVQGSLSTGGSLSIENDKIVFDLTPQQRQKDVNITITLNLNDKIVSKTILLPALGSSVGHYKYHAVAPSTDLLASRVSVMINGRNYTVIPYSFSNVAQSNAETSGITINGSVRGKAFSGFKIANNYADTKILLKVYEGKTLFDFTTLVGDSGIITLASNSINIGNIAVSRTDDFQPIEPNDRNIELPPVAPEF